MDSNSQYRNQTTKGLDIVFYDLNCTNTSLHIQCEIELSAHLSREMIILMPATAPYLPNCVCVWLVCYSVYVRIYKFINLHHGTLESLNQLPVSVQLPTMSINHTM